MSSVSTSSKLSNAALVGVIGLVGFILLIIVVVEINKIKNTVNNINESTTILGGQNNESRTFNLSANESETQSIPIPNGWCINYIEFTSYSTTNVSGNTQYKIGTTSGGAEIKSLTSTGLGSSDYTKLSTINNSYVGTEASCVLTDTTAYLTLVNSKATSIVIQAHIYYYTIYDYAAC